ncbi:MAG: hypothetical protein ACYTEZ_07515 [Planctomycetota bacterium]|jgi:hypothetical protein
MKQLTIRGFDKELERRIRRLARTEGISLNKAVLRLLRKGAGLAEDKDRREVVGDSLDALVGTWTPQESRAFAKAVRDLERIDPALWK